MRLFWHQRDLRIPDNAGLRAAARDETVVPVYVHDETLCEALGTRQRAFFVRGVEQLREQYRQRGSDLVIRRGNPAEMLPALAAEFGASEVFYNAHYRAARRDRQERVTDALAAEGIDTTSRTDRVLVDPARLDPSYPTHSQFHNDWTSVPKRTPYETPADSAFADIPEETPLPDVDADIELPPAGYRAARNRLDTFCADGIGTYAETRDDLERAIAAPTLAVSRLSPYLATGMVGIREVWAAATDAYERASGDERRNVSKYRYELSWREHNYHLLYYNANLPEANYDDPPNEIAWRNDDEDFTAWQAGETGYPLVDAGMRQLAREGYIHNRPRQVVASFLTKHLLVDWRRGARHFREQLLDHDWANNAGNWQWIASTGTDSVAVRIFDPVAQMAKYDEDAVFVREYVPELRDVPAEKIVDWPTLPREERDRLAPEYHALLVDRDEAYERAQRVFERALGRR